MPVSTVTVRVDKNGHPRKFIKVADPKKWVPYAIYVYEKARGTIPAGWIVRHSDRDSMNDEVYNLEATTRAEHLAEHRDEHLRIKRMKRKQRA